MEGSPLQGGRRAQAGRQAVVRVSNEAHFSDRLAALVEERRSQVVLGLDPDPMRLLPGSEVAAQVGSNAERAATAVVHHCRRLIKAVSQSCVAVKLQVACFERLGPAGLQAMFEVAKIARQAGLLVIADAKRGDVPVTAEVYAQAFLGEVQTPWGPIAGLGADAMTVNPLLGRDSLMPLVERAAERGAGLFILVRTSNPGAADLQDLQADGRPVHERVAQIVDELGSGALGTLGSQGLSDIGAVVGATAPEHFAALRKRMPRSIFLVPGIGAQGGSVEDLKTALGDQPASILVTASRSIAFAYERNGGEPDAAAAAEAEALRQAAWQLAE